MTSLLLENVKLYLFNY